MGVQKKKINKGKKVAPAPLASNKLEDVGYSGTCTVDDDDGAADDAGARRCRCHSWRRARGMWAPMTSSCPATMWGAVGCCRWC